MTIEAIGADGDGLSRLPGGTALFVPFTLPGEQVRVRPAGPRGQGRVAVLESIETPSPERASPPCPHFGRCGGCALQHWRDGPLRDWKAERVAIALRHAGFLWQPTDPETVPSATRRRVDLAVRRHPGGVVLGLNAARSEEVLAIPECAVLHPALRALLPPLRDTIDRLAALRRSGSVTMNLLDTGPDLLLHHDAPLTVQDRQRLIDLAERHGIPRIATRQGRAEWETACQLDLPTIAFAGTAVTPPPGAFLQPTSEGEAAIVRAVLAGLPDRLPARAHLVELFAGIGTLTFPLATRARVVAFEGQADAVRALAAAAIPGRVTAVARDLARQPVLARDLAPAAAVILDPPFSGAAEQMPAIAAALVPVVIYVSCNPVALARDGRALAAAGYRLRAAHIIDQFRWSPHVEAVAVFDKERSPGHKAGAPVRSPHP